ncbi:MAG: hypothetical protein WCG79_01355 [Verrucomicrobiota bacterium]
MSVTFKTTLIAGALALAANTGSVLLLMATGITYQWLFVMRLIDFAIHIEPTWLGESLAFTFGFVQFFILFWIVVRLKYGMRAG